MRVQFARVALSVAATFQRASVRITAFVYDHVDTTLLPSEEVPVSVSRPVVEYHVHLPHNQLSESDVEQIRAASAKYWSMRYDR